MAVRPDSSSTFTFGDFQLDCRVPELKKHGRTVRMPQQPIQILSVLIAAAGDVVTRETLRNAVWTHDTHVDFDRGINKAINRLRQVLGDRSERPRFIETVPRRGYRFVAVVTAALAPERVISPEVRETLLKADISEASRPSRRSPAVSTTSGRRSNAIPSTRMHGQVSPKRTSCWASSA